MKKKIIILCAVLAALGPADMFAQGRYGKDSINCIRYLSFYQDYYKQKDYDDAVISWRKAYRTCPPKASVNMLSHGTVLVSRLIAKNAKDPEYRQALLDTLFTLYDQSVEYNPKKAVETMNNKGIDIHKYVTDPEILFQEYEAIIAFNKEKTKPSFFSYDLKEAIDRYQDNKMSAEEVIAIYQRNNELIDKYKPKNSADSTQTDKVKKDLDGMFAASSVASCDNLIAIYKPQFDADPENLQLVTMIAKTMGSVDDCQDNDLFIGAVVSMNKLNPSAASAFYLYKLYSKQDNVSEAVRYLSQAVESPDCGEEEKEDYLFELASYCYRNGRNGDAVTYATKLTGSTRYAGRAYFLIGGIWGSVGCGGNEIESAAHFWVAYDYMQKARNLDSSLADDAARSMSSFSARFPSAADAFMYNLSDGQSYTVNCGGMRAVTTVRTNK